MIQGMEATVEVEIEIEIELDPAVVIPIFSAACAVLCLAIGLFAHYKPRNAFVRWLDRNYFELLIVFAVGIFLAFLAFVAAKPPEIASTESLTIFGCCLIAWFSLTALAFYRHCHNKVKNEGNDNGETATTKAKKDNAVIEMFAEMF